MLLKLLERSGLTATQQGSALVLTVHGFDEEMKVEDISRMPCKEFAELYTVHIWTKNCVYCWAHCL